MYAVLKTLLSRPVLPFLVAIGALVPFALGYLGVFAATFDFFAQFTTHWLIVAIMAVAASFATRYAYRILAAGIVFAVLLPAVLAGWYTAKPTATELGKNTALTTRADNTSGPAPGTRRSFKLLSYNTYNPNLDLDAIWEEIRRHDADVVVLIEFGRNKRSLRRRMAARYPYYRVCKSGRVCTLGLYSRLPAAQFKVVGYRDDAGPSLISAEIKVGSMPVTVVGTHIINPKNGPRANYAELDHLAERVRRWRGPIVVAGDLNTTIWANAFDNFRRKSGLTHMGRLVPTWPTRPLPLPQIGIDHLFASPQLRLVDVSVGRAAGSDHLPLVATVELRPGYQAVSRARPITPATERPITEPPITEPPITEPQS